MTTVDRLNLVINHSPDLWDGEGQDFSASDGHRSAVNSIKDELLLGRASTIMVGGRPGSGKSVVIAKALREVRTDQRLPEVPPLVELRINAGHSFEDPCHLYFALLRELEWQLHHQGRLRRWRGWTMVSPIREPVKLPEFQPAWPRFRQWACYRRYFKELPRGVRKLLNLAVERTSYSIAVDKSSQANVAQFGSLVIGSSRRLESLGYEAVDAQADLTRLLDSVGRTLRLVVVIDELDKLAKDTAYDKIKEITEWLKPLAGTQGKHTFILVTDHRFFWAAQRRRAVAAGTTDLFSRMVYVGAVKDLGLFLNGMGDNYQHAGKSYLQALVMRSFGLPRRALQDLSYCISSHNAIADSPADSESLSGIAAHVENVYSKLNAVCDDVCLAAAGSVSMRDPFLRDEYEYVVRSFVARLFHGSPLLSKKGLSSVADELADDVVGLDRDEIISVGRLTGRFLGLW